MNDKLYEIYIYLNKKITVSEFELVNIKSYLTHLNENNFHYESDYRKEEIYLRYKLMINKLLDVVKEKERNNEYEKFKLLESKYDESLDSYLNHIKNYESDTIIFNFSGTNKIQNIEGNRPIKMTVEFLSKNIPVIYSFWAWKNTPYFLEKYSDGLLFQSPIQKTMDNIEKIIKYDFKYKNKIFILSFPYPDAVKYLDLFKQYNWKIIYDIRDDWEEFHKEKQATWYDYESEIASIKKSDIVTAVSSPLVEKFEAKCNKKIYLLPNALDTKFQITTNKYKRSKIGYVGKLTPAWFDWKTMIIVANELSNCTFEIIGDHSNLDTKDIPSNIHFLGAKTFDEVIEISTTWKVGIIPFKKSVLSYGVDPIKVYEYLAMGLKVVSSDIPQIYNYPQVSIAKSTSEFVEYINKSLNEEFDYNTTKEFLKVNTWECRVNRMLELSKKKILYIYQYCILGGVTTQLVNRLKEFNEKYECHFAFLKDYGGSVVFGNYKNIYILKDENDFYELMKIYNYDIISVIDTNIVYKWLEKVAYNGFIINEVHTTTSNIDKIKELKDNLPMDIILTPSQYMKSLIKDDYAFKDIVAVEVLPNCLDFNKFKYTPTNTNSIYNKIPILWVGKLDNHKKIFDFLKICNILQTKYNMYKFEYIIVGGITAPDVTIDKFIDVLKEYNILKDTIWYSSIAYDDMYKLYSYTKENKGVYISTTLNESFGMTVLEAMAVGVSIVVPNVGALVELPYDNEYSIYEIGNFDKACELIVKQIEKDYKYKIQKYEPYKIKEIFVDIVNKYNKKI